MDGFEEDIDYGSIDEVDDLDYYDGWCLCGLPLGICDGIHEGDYPIDEED